MNAQSPAAGKSAIVLAHAAPNASFLAGLHRPLQAGVHDRARAADPLGFLNLDEGRTGVADREEEFRILVTAGCLVAPVHAVLLPQCRTHLMRI